MCLCDIKSIILIYPQGAWRGWLKIGTESTKFSLADIDKQSDDLYIPSQAFLTALVQIFPALFAHIHAKFNDNDLQKLCAVLMNAVMVPVHSDSTPYIMSTMSDSLLTPLHDGVLDCIEILQKEAMADTTSVKTIICAVFKELLSFSKFACAPPYYENRKRNGTATTYEWISMNYIPFGEKSLNIAVKLYTQTASDERVIEGQIMHEIVKALALPLGLKYKCMSASTWKLAVNSLMTVLQHGLPVARKHPKDFVDMWPDLADTLDKFLFPKSVCQVEDRGLEELVLDESIDCQLIEQLRDEVLPYSGEIPNTFVMNVVVILNKGSIHSATATGPGCENEVKLREEFAKTCFDTLLQFSLLDDNGNKDATNIQIVNSNETNNNGVAGQLAITALLHRFGEVLKKFNDDERQTGKFPLPRYRMSEISFVLKAVATLIISMKKAPPVKGKLSGC